MTRRASATARIVIVLLLAPASAFGHGETETTDPEARATLRKAPRTVSVTLTEPPARGARLEVRDGCGEIVSRSEKIEDEVLSTKIASGEPGRWRAAYEAVSSVDGHVTKDTFVFKVKGKRDCSPDGNGNGENPGDDDAEGREGGPNARGSGDEREESSFPVVPVAVGTLVLVAGALVIRTRSAR